MPQAGLPILLLAAVFWIVGFYIPGIAQYFYASRWSASIIIGALAIIVIARMGRLKLKQINKAIILLLLILLASTSYSFVPLYTILRSMSAILLIVSTYMLSVAIVRNEDDIKVVFYAITVLYLCLILVFFTSTVFDPYAFSSNRLQANQYFKATGGGAMIVSAVLILFWLQKFCIRKYRKIVVVIIIGLIISLIATKSRAPIAGALLLWPIGWTMIQGRKFGRGILLFLAICGVLASTIYSNSDAKKYLRIDEQAISNQGYDISTGRFQRWEFLLDEAYKKPIFGHGFGTSRYARWRFAMGEHATLQWTAAINTTRDQELSHNQHVQIFYEVGTIGLLLFWTICFLLLKTGMKVLYLPYSPVNLMLKMVFLSICFHLIDSFSHDGLLSPGNPNSYIFWFKVGFLMQGYAVVVMANKNQKRAFKLREKNLIQAPDGISYSSMKRLR